MTDDFIILDRAMKHYTSFTLDVTDDDVPHHPRACETGRRHWHLARH